MNKKFKKYHEKRMQDNEYALEYTKINPEAIKLMKNPNEAMQMAAIRQDYTLIHYIKNPSDKAKSLAASYLNDAIMEVIG